jgi:hypothetical protein
MMVAQPQHTSEAVDAAIYSTPAPLYLLPARTKTAIEAENTRKPRKKRAPIRIVDMQGAVHTATDETFEQVAADVLPMKALEPDYPAHVFTTPVMPIDEPDVQPSLTSEHLPCINQDAAKYVGGLAMPKYTLRVPMRTPLGQRVLVPECSRYMLASDTFWYRFEIMPGMSKWFAEDELSLVGE